jgi:stage II sporulation protein R
MKQKYHLFLCITCLLIALFIGLSKNRQNDEALAARIAPQILRFHVLANSNCSADQKLKLKVRTQLLNLIYDDLGENASLKETKSFVLSHKKALEEKAEQYMNHLGYHYSAHMKLTNCYFPKKIYGDMVFPCGNYEALQVTLGKGRGHNWWCVLYPPLCFVDSSYAVVPENSKKTLRDSISPADYRKLNRKEVKIHIRLKLTDFLPKKTINEIKNHL